MEVFQTEKYYIFVKKENSLWWNRITSEFSIKAGKRSEPHFLLFFITKLLSHEKIFTINFVQIINKFIE